MSTTVNSASDREQKTTITLAGAAAACLLVTGAIELLSSPASIEEFGKNGQEFYAEFNDPTTASALSVASIDTDSIKPVEFSVQKLDNGRWVIPSHHDYPADAKDQLAKTAASVIGIKRGALVTRWSADHAKYGVVNPKTDSVTVDEVEGIGTRLTLRGEDDSVLVDYIIGKEVEDQTDAFYVRHPDEDEVYITDLDIDLSTKFADWIETDLFDISTSDVVHVSLDDYEYDELQGTLTQSIVTEINRKSSTDDWEMKDLDTESLEVDEDSARETLNAISGLEIEGVRPKQKGLTPELTLDRSALKSQNDLIRLQRDLESRGFLLQPANPNNPDQLKLIARYGELSTGTNDGLVYNMYFGRVFTGSQEELEIGISSGGGDETKSNDGDKEEEGEGDADDSEGDGSEADEDSGKPGRYVFVTVSFDKRHLGEEPAMPTEPEMPEELTKAAEEKEESSEEAKEDAEGKDGEDAEEKEDPIKKLQEEYDTAKEDYEADLKEYEAFQEKIKEGTEKAGELNRRFAMWYYVVPGDDYDKLAHHREDLTKEKEKEESEGDDKPEGAATDLPIGLNPAAPPTENGAATEPAKPEMKKDDAPKEESGKPAADANPEDAAKPETPKEEPKPVVPEEEPKAETPQDEPKPETPEEPAEPESPAKPSDGNPDEPSGDDADKPADEAPASEEPADSEPEPKADSE